MKRKNILLVEDDYLLALAESELLEAGGYGVIHAPTGEVALETLAGEGHDIDLVLMDFDLGAGMDGAEAAGRIARGHGLPLLFLTSRGRAEVAERVGPGEGFGFVPKNSPFASLDSAMKAAFRHAAGVA